MDFYVIKDSGIDESSVTLLKAEPLSYEEIEEYSAGTGASISNQNGYGGMQYHASSSSYEGSYVKATVDTWKTVQAPTAIEVRLITNDDLTDNLGYERNNAATIQPSSSGTTPAWVYNSNYFYWTMSPYNDSSSGVRYVSSDGSLSNNYIASSAAVFRSVITISKSVL